MLLVVRNYLRLNPLSFGSQVGTFTAGQPDGRDSVLIPFHSGLRLERLYFIEIQHMTNVLIPFHSGLRLEPISPNGTSVAILVLIPFHSGLRLERFRP